MPRARAQEKVGQVRLQDPPTLKEVRRESKRRTNRLHAQDLLRLGRKRLCGYRLAFCLGVRE